MCYDCQNCREMYLTKTFYQETAKASPVNGNGLFGYREMKGMNRRSVTAPPCDSVCRCSTDGTKPKQLLGHSALSVSVSSTTGNKGESSTMAHPVSPVLVSNMHHSIDTSKSTVGILNAHTVAVGGVLLFHGYTKTGPLALFTEKPSDMPISGGAGRNDSRHIVGLAVLACTSAGDRVGAVLSLSAHTMPAHNNNNKTTKGVNRWRV